MREGDNPRQPGSDQLDHGVGSSGLCEERVVVGAGGSSSVKKGDISLRKWLDRPARKVDHLVCLHIFRQIVKIVNLAHSQGIVLHNVRPSCFLMSSFGRVSYMESSSARSSPSSSSSFDTYKDALKNRITEGQSSSLSSPHELHKQRIILGHEGSSTLEINPADAYEKVSGTGCLWLSSPYATRLASIEKREERKVGDKEKSEQVHESKKNFPLNQILLTEISWYTSPEEVVGSPSSFSSDIYRLGVLLFELFCTFSSIEEKLRTMSNLRHRILPPHLLLKCSKEASFCLWLLHPQPATRPKMIELIQSEFLNESRVDSEERESAIKRKEEIEEQELLVEFLLVMHQSKQEACDKLHNVISCLSSDIEEVMNEQLMCKKKGVLYQERNNDGFSASENVDHPPLGLLINEDSARLGSRKRFRPRLQINDEKELYEHLEKFQVSKEHLDTHDIQSKSSRMMNNFEMLQSAYFSTRCSLIKPTKALTNRCSRIGSNDKGSIVITEGSSVDNFGSKEGKGEDRRSGCINPFVEGLYKYLAFNKLKVKADLKHGDLLSSSNLVCSLSFDRDRELFASAGVNRKIKIFECDMILKQNHDTHYPVIEMATRSKLSSICWNSYIKSQIASSDFDGVVQIWDVVQGQVFMEMNEHDRRVWSVDYSVADPTKLVSGSDDGTVKLWNINQGRSIGTIKTKANVCCVQFPPDSARSIVIGSADHKIYCYDLRNTRTALSTLIGHNKTVSYVKYIDSSTLVSASTDNSLKLWDLSTCTSQVLVNPLQTFTGHTNVKNFVGLSIYDGYIATGSETNEVFIYHKAFPTPILSFKFSCTDLLAEQFVSSVCWRGQSSTLLAANSTGNIKILEMDLLEWFCYLGFEENILLDRVGVVDSRIQTEVEALALQGLKMAEDLNTKSLIAFNIVHLILGRMEALGNSFIS